MSDIVYLIMHDYLKNIHRRYERAVRTGAERCIGAEAVQAVAQTRMEVCPQLLERHMTAGDRLRARHDLAGIALRLGILARSLSPDSETWFDAAGSLSTDERADILSEVYDNPLVPPSGAAEQYTRTAMTAAERQCEPRRARMGNAPQYMAIWRDTDARSTRQAIPFGAFDAIFVQAYGRDSYTDEELPVIAARRREVGSDTRLLDELIADDFRPGPANEALAENTKYHVERFGVEAMAQWEVAVALRAQDVSWYDAYVSAIHVLWPRGDFYPTYDVKHDSIARLKERGLYEPLELAHAGMLPRAQAIIRQQGVMSQVARHDVTVPYDPASTQPWVRSRLSWLPREAATRAHHVLFGKVSF